MNFYQTVANGTNGIPLETWVYDAVKKRPIVYKASKSVNFKYFKIIHEKMVFITA